MTNRVFIFECSSDTYITCVEKNLFGSNKNWPLQITQGDYCLLHHLEAGALFALWQAESDGGRNLMPRLWSGKFPYQVKVRLLTPKVVEVPKALIQSLDVDPVVGRFDNAVDLETGAVLVQSLLNQPKIV